MHDTCIGNFSFSDSIRYVFFMQLDHVPEPMIAVPERFARRQFVNQRVVRLLESVLLVLNVQEDSAHVSKYLK